MKLPIDVVPNTSPPRFVWRQKVSTPVGDKEVEYIATIPSAVETAVLRLIECTKRLMLDNAALQGTVDALNARAAEQEESAPAPPAPAAPAPVSHRKRGRDS